MCTETQTPEVPELFLPQFKPDSIHVLNPMHRPNIIPNRQAGCEDLFRRLKSNDKKIAEVQRGQSSRHLNGKTDPDTVQFVVTFGYIWASKEESDRLLFQATTVKHAQVRRRGNCLHWGIYLISEK